MIDRAFQTITQMMPELLTQKIISNWYISVVIQQKSLA